MTKKFMASADVWKNVRKELNKFRPIDVETVTHLETMFEDLTVSEGLAVLRELLYEIKQEGQRNDKHY